MTTPRLLTPYQIIQRGSELYILIHSTPGATLTCGSDSYTLTSAENYHIFIVAAGTYTCTASLTGYNSKTESVTVTNSGVEIDLYLTLLPEEYQQVEYIETPNRSFLNPYIDADIQITPEIEVITKGCILNVSGYATLVGGRNNNSGNGRFMPFACSGNGNYVRVTYGDYDSQASVTPTNVITIDYNNSQHQMLIDDVVVATFTTTLATANPSTLYVFALAGYSDPAYQCAAQLYSLVIKNNVTGVKIRDFIPCYTKDTKTCGLYDLVSNRFFQNAASGSSMTFIAGQDITQ